MPRPPTAWRETYERHLLALQARTGVPGMGVTLFTADDVLLSRGLGSRDREAGLPVTEDTLFGVASITKSFTALAVLQLVTDGRLSLDDAVSEHLPFTLWDGREPARIRHFLSHTSGLPALPTMDWVRAPSQLGDPVTGKQAEKRVANPVPDVRTPERLVAWIDANAVLLGEPGEVFSYSNDAFCLLGGIVERVADRPFDDFVEERIARPLGMARTTFDLERVLADPDHSTLYERDESGTVLPSPRWETTARLLGGGMLKSTLGDLRRYVRYLMAPASIDRTSGGPDIDPELVRAMSAANTWSGPGRTYGFGLITQTDHHGKTLVGHGGSLKGVSSQIGWVPQLGIGGVVLSNLVDIPSEGVWVSGVNARTGVPVDARPYAPGSYTASAAEVAEVLGRYASGEPYGRLRFYVNEGGALRAGVGDPETDVPARFAAADEIALTFPEHEAPATLLRGDDGKIRGVTYGLRVLLREA